MCIEATRYKAVMTQAGAYRMNRPDLAEKEIEYTVSLDVDGAVCTDKMFYQDECIGGLLSFTGDSPGLVDKDENWKRVL